MKKDDSTAKTIKLQAWLARQGVASRRGAEELIADGRVQVNGVSAHIGQRVTETDLIELDGEVVKVETEQKLVYFLVNKPAGVVSTTSDELGRKNILDLLPRDVTEKYRLFPVGRLDMDSEGLMLLTNDGQFTHQLTHPSFEHQKTYRVLVAGVPSDKALAHLERGVELDDELVETDNLEILSQDDGNTWLEITVHQGKYHQVKRMMMRIGYEVIRLERTKLGPYLLEELEEAEAVFLPVEKRELNKTE
jgi:23S rRNA pseudouridine2605 synthase